MAVETIIILVLSVLVAFLAAAAARFYIDLWECRAETEKRGDQIEEQRKDFRVLCIEKINLSEQLTAAENRADKAEAENKHLNDLLDSLLVELESGPEPEPEKIPEAKSGKDVPEITWTLDRLPEGHTNVISGMPYTTITDKKSEQWALQLQAYTGKYGIRCYFDGDHIYFLAAMGSAYGRTIGDAFRVTLNCGTVMYVMLGEFKDDGTDPNFFGHPTTHADGYDVTCVLEFIYDAEHINSKALQAGNFCNIGCFGGLHGDGGDIAKIEYLGRRWEP